eukprot:COSAG06_NODE_8760_length_2077_cov_1.351871_2_plen_84_part_00
MSDCHINVNVSHALRRHPHAVYAVDLALTDLEAPVCQYVLCWPTYSTPQGCSHATTRPDKCVNLSPQVPQGWDMELHATFNES